VIDLYGMGHWPGLVMLVLVAAATVTTPHWNRAWAVRQVELAQHRDGSDTDEATTSASSFSSGAPTRPVVGQGGGR